MKLKNDVIGYKFNVYGKRGEQIKIISTYGHVCVVENVKNKDRYGVHEKSIDFSEPEIKTEQPEKAPIEIVPAEPQIIINKEKQAPAKVKVAAPTKQQTLF